MLYMVPAGPREVMMLEDYCIKGGREKCSIYLYIRLGNRERFNGGSAFVVLMHPRKLDADNYSAYPAPSCTATECAS